MATLEAHSVLGVLRCNSSNQNNEVYVSWTTDIKGIKHLKSHAEAARDGLVAKRRRKFQLTCIHVGCKEFHEGPRPLVMMMMRIGNLSNSFEGLRGLRRGYEIIIERKVSLYSNSVQ
jgi:hypothetical protein